MTEAEWLASDDPIAMLGVLRANWRGKDLERLIHLCLLDCCRAIWPLLPMEASRQGVEVAERYILGRATREEYGLAEWQAEGAAFFLDFVPDEDNPEASDAIRSMYDRMRREREKWWTPEEKESYRQYLADGKARIELMVKDVEAIPVAEMRRMVRTIACGDNIPPLQLLEDAAYFAHFAMVYPGVRPREGAIERYSQFLSATLLRAVVGSAFLREG
jgi:hypothetical protein